MNTKKESLGDRQKAYENVTRYSMPYKSFVMARIDGKAFHTYTKGLKRPFDEGLVKDMDKTAISLCESIQGARFAYVQSDEISVFIHEPSMLSEPWFGNNIQKMASVAASVATVEFNALRISRLAQDIMLNSAGSDIREKLTNLTFGEWKSACFDARFWTIPQAVEVHNYMVYRQQDAIRNSIQAVAQSLFSNKEIMNKNTTELKEMIVKSGNTWWDNYPEGQKQGRFIEKITYTDFTQFFSDKQPQQVARTKWEVVPAPIFSEQQSFLMERIKSCLD